MANRQTKLQIIVPKTEVIKLPDTCNNLCPWLGHHQFARSMWTDLHEILRTWNNEKLLKAIDIGKQILRK